MNIISVRVNKQRLDDDQNITSTYYFFIRIIYLNEELRDLYTSPSISRIIKSRRMRLVSHVAQMGEKRNGYRLLVGKS
jgi:hypothetical protein